MTGHTPPAGACEMYQDELVELALGILTGRERAEALEHLDACSRCTAELEDLTRTADQLLQIAPEADPPVGFEVRLFERLGVKPPRRRRLAVANPQRALILLGAAAVIAVAGFAVGRWQAPSAPAHPSSTEAGSPGGALLSAALTATGGNSVVGEAYISPGSPGWLLMTMDDGSLHSEVTCQLVLSEGHTITLGSFWLSDGYGSWTVALPASTAKLTGTHLLRIVTASGSVVASATIAI